jgi:excisionase family DNA binding protein
MTETIDKLLTVEDVMENLRISRPTLYRLLQSNRLVPVRIGKRTLFDPKDIKAFVEASKGVAQPKATKKKPEQKKQPKAKRDVRKHKDNQGDAEPTQSPATKETPKAVSKKTPGTPEGQGTLL